MSVDQGASWRRLGIGGAVVWKGYVKRHHVLECLFVEEGGVGCTRRVALWVSGSMTGEVVV